MKTIKLNDGRIVDLYCHYCEGRGKDIGSEYFIDDSEEDSTPLLPNIGDDHCPNCGRYMTLEIPLSSIPPILQY